MMPQTLSKALRALATAESISAEVEVATAARGFAVAASSTSNALAPGRSLNEPSMNAPHKGRFSNSASTALSMPAAASAAGDEWSVRVAGCSFRLARSTGT